MAREWLTLNQVAGELGVSRKTVKRMVDEGELPAHFFAGAYRIEKNQFEKWLESCKVKPGQPVEENRERNFSLREVS